MRNFSQRPPLKWFKDDSDIVRSLKINEKEETEKETKEEKKKRDELIIAEESREECVVEKDTQKKLITEDNYSNRHNEKAIPSIGNSDFPLLEESFHCSDDSKSDYEVTSRRSSTNLLVKEMDQKSLQKFYAKMKKQRPDQNLIDKVLKGRYSRMNPVFNAPEKAIPLPRKSGTINISFSERAFPTPARESSHVEEQEVRYTLLIINYRINISS